MPINNEPILLRKRKQRAKQKSNVEQKSNRKVRFQPSVKKAVEDMEAEK